MAHLQFMRDYLYYVVFDGLRSKQMVTTNTFGKINSEILKQNSGDARLALDCYFQTEKYIYAKAQHGDEIVVFKNPNKYHFPKNIHVFPADGLIFIRNKNEYFEKYILSLTTGDCPCLIIEAEDDENKAVALVHSSWMCAEKNIVAKALAKLIHKGPFAINSIRIGLWPGICGNCYEVGADVRKALSKYSGCFRRGKDSEHWQLNMAGLITEQLSDAGIAYKQIEIPKFCSACSFENGKPLFFSYRRDCYGQLDKITNNGIFLLI